MLVKISQTVVSSPPHILNYPLHDIREDWIEWPFRGRLYHPQSLRIRYNGLTTILHQFDPMIQIVRVVDKNCDQWEVLDNLKYLTLLQYFCAHHRRFFMKISN